MKYKNGALFSVLLISILVVSGCIGQSSEPAVNLNIDAKFTTYEDSVYNIKISYPENWVSSEEYGTVFLFSSLKGQSINLIYLDLTEEPLTLDEYTELAKRDIELYSTDAYPTSIKKITLSELPAYSATYNARIGNIEVRTMQAWTIKDNKLYVLTYAAPTKETDNSLGSRIMDSFEIIG